MKPTVMIVEDEASLVTMLRYNLEKEGYNVTEASDGEEAVTVADETPPDAVILDWMLPRMSGIEVCRQLRRKTETRTVPIIMLTARSEETDKVRGLNVGADDYMTKPFSMPELVARVRALLRRAQRTTPADNRLAYGVLTVDVDRHLVKVAGEEVKLTAKEFLLLHYLMEHRGRVLSRDLLLSDVWSYSYTGGTRTVDVHVRRLREKLPSLVTALETVKQFGYKLTDVEGA